MKSPVRIVPCLIALLLIAGCASTKVTDRDIAVTEKIPRPKTIWVYDFAATPADLPADSVIAGKHSEHSAPQTPEQIAAGRQVGAEIAQELVAQIRAMGIPAERASQGTKMQVNDLMIRGYLLSLDEGSEAKRLTVGFGAGGSALKVAAEGFQITAQGMRKLGSGTTQSGGGKTPGAGVGLAALLVTGNPVGLLVSSGVKVYGEASGSAKIEGRAKQTAKEIADQLKVRFKEQGWVE